MSNKIISHPYTSCIELLSDRPLYLGVAPKVNYQKIFADLSLFNRIVNYACQYFEDKSIDVFVTPAFNAAGGVNLTGSVALKLGKPFVVGGDPKRMPGVKGTYKVTVEDNMRIIELSLRDIHATQKVGIITDITTNGATLNGFIEILHDRGAHVHGILSLVGFPRIYNNYKHAKTLNRADIKNAFNVLDGEIIINPDVLLQDDSIELEPPQVIYTAKALRKHITIHPDHYKKGLMWTDYDGLLASRHGFPWQFVCHALADELLEKAGDKPDLVVGVAVRGQHLASAISTILAVPQVNALKSENMLVEATKFSNPMRYDSTSLSIQNGLIQPGQKTVLVDDIKESGGTILTAINIIENFGGKVIGKGSFIEITDTLRASSAWSKLKDYNNVSLVNYTSKELEELGNDAK